MLHRTRKFTRTITIPSHDCALCGTHTISLPTRRFCGYTWDGAEIWSTEHVCTSCALELSRELKAPVTDDIEVPAF